MNNITCKVGYIYALYYNGYPFYIGQTTVKPRKRFNKHRTDTFRSRQKDVYDFIKSVTTIEKFYDDISMRILKCCSVRDLNVEEMNYIKHCIRKKLTIYNNCVKTKSYRLKIEKTNL